MLVSNAGATVRAPLESVPLAEVERLYQLNTLGALRVAQAVPPAMRNRGSGRLVFVSSIQGRMVLPIIGPYGASKWALEAIRAVVADTIEHPEPPLRVPAGAPAERALTARKEAPESEPFVLAKLDW